MCKWEDKEDWIKLAIVERERDEARKLAEEWRDYCQTHCQVHWATDSGVVEPHDEFPWEVSDE